MNPAAVIGLAGWSGAGKTTLLSRLIPLLVTRGVKVATIKHAHHAFDVDHPGKDSYVHREAGASEVIVSSSRRWVQASLSACSTWVNAGVPCRGSGGKYVPAKNGSPSGVRMQVIGHPP